MASKLPRGTRREPVRTGWLIEKDAKMRLEELAERADVSAAVFLEKLVDSIETTDAGLPIWWPADAKHSEELPIDSA